MSDSIKTTPSGDERGLTSTTLEQQTRLKGHKESRNWHWNRIQELDGTLAHYTNNKHARDPLGRFISKDRALSTTTTTSWLAENIILVPTSTDSTRPSSRLSGTYEIITPDISSLVGTPFSSRPTTPPRFSTKANTETEDMAAEVITPFHGDKEDENPEDFLRAFYRRMGDKSDETKKAQFQYYLQADSVADEWYADLVDNEKKAWGDIEAAFKKRWLRKKQARKTEEDYEDEILSRKLKDEDLGKMEKIAGRDVYSHVAWADKMATSVKGAKLEKSTNNIRQVRRELPGILREKVGTGHADWNAFLQAVRDVDVEYIRDCIDIKNKERAALDQRYRTFETISKSPTAPLRQQLSSVAISSQPVTPAATPSNINPFLNTGGGQGNLRFTTNAATQQYIKPPQTNFAPRPPPTPEQKAELLALLATIPHHPDTQAGRQAHQAQQAEWVRTYGFGTRVTEKTPYPLRPGTAPVNSGECFTCGQGGHLGTRTGEVCQAMGHRPLHPNEQQWRVICARILKEPKRVADVRFLTVDDYGTTWQGSQGNEEGPST